MSAAVADGRRTDPRPALADVLATLTGESRGAWLAILREYVGLPRDMRWERDALVWGRPWQAQREGVRDPRVTRRGLTAATPAEAVEVLATRDLWPWAPGDDAAPRWWCEECRGRGWTHGGDVMCRNCDNDPAPLGTRADPPTLAALVAVASLGVDALRRAEGLALQLVGRAPRLVWRTMTREALRAWAYRTGRRVGEPPVTVAQAAALASMPAESEGWAGAVGSWLDRWSGPSPWWLREAPADVVAAWPALRDLAALGVTPVALDGDRITLAVEAI